MTEPQTHNLWLFLELLARRKRLIFFIIIIATISSAVVSLVLPKWYRATAVLLPPKNLSVPLEDLGNWSDVMSVTAGLNLPVRATPSDVYARMLQSRTITSRVMDRFGLMDIYGESNYEEAYEALMDHSDFYVSDEGLLIVSVEDRDPQMAADITNSFVDLLDSVNIAIVSERINQTKTFLAERLLQVKAEMGAARDSLEAFQMKNRAVDFDEQTRLAIEQAAALKVTLAGVELKLRMGELTLGKDNAELIELQQQRTIVLRQLQQLETVNADSSFFSLPVAAIPSLKGQYEELYSRVEVAEALYQVLLEQSEKAKIKEYEKMPTISVLDRAKPPTLKSRPQRGIIVASTFGLSIIFALFVAAVVDYFGRLRNRSPEDHERLMFFVSAYFGWLPGVKSSRKAGGAGTPGNKQGSENVNLRN